MKKKLPLLLQLNCINKEFVKEQMLKVSALLFVPKSIPLQAPEITLFFAFEKYQNDFVTMFAKVYLFH